MCRVWPMSYLCQLSCSALHSRCVASPFTGLRLCRQPPLGLLWLRWRSYLEFKARGICTPSRAPGSRQQAHVSNAISIGVYTIGCLHLLCIEKLLCIA